MSDLMPFDSSQGSRNKSYKFLNVNITVDSCSMFYSLLSYYNDLLLEKKEAQLVRKMIIESAAYYWKPFSLLSVDRKEAIESAIWSIYIIENRIIQLEKELKMADNLDKPRVKPRDTGKTINFKIQLCLNRKDEDEIRLCAYLKQKQPMGLEEKILLSGDAFYGVEAYKNTGFYETEDIKLTIISCLSKLKAHQELLRSIFPEIASGDRGDKNIKEENKEDKVVALKEDKKIVEEKPKYAPLAEEFAMDEDDILFKISQNLYG